MNHDIQIKLYLYKHTYVLRTLGHSLNNFTRLYTLVAIQVLLSDDILFRRQNL